MSEPTNAARAVKEAAQGLVAQATEAALAARAAYALAKGEIASAGGAVLAGATRVTAALRPAAKPLHPVGQTVRGRIYRYGSDTTTGVPWLDERGEDDVVVRASRAIGLPGALPDVHGLAIRVPTTEGPGDLLLASTGWGRLSRFLLTVSRDPSHRPMSTLLPYRTATQGPVLIGARTTTPNSYSLHWAPYRGEWREFGVLILSGRPAAHPELSFDPVRHQLPRLEQYPAIVRLREPAYMQARAGSAHTSDRNA